MKGKLKGGEEKNLNVLYLFLLDLKSIRQTVTVPATVRQLKVLECSQH